MKYVIAGLTALVLSSLVATSVHATSGTGPDVCSYTVTNTFGVSCPIRNGQTACFSVSAKIGNCDSRLECFGGPGFFCKATLIPKSGPEAKCPFGSVRPRGFSCFRPIVIGPVNTPTFTPTSTPLPDTPTGTPTGTAEATATVTDTPQEATATVTDTPAEATATVTDTPAEATATATDTPPEATATVTGTPTGTAEATATVTQTGTPTGTAAASLVLRF